MVEIPRLTRRPLPAAGGPVASLAGIDQVGDAVADFGAAVGGELLRVEERKRQRSDALAAARVLGETRLALSESLRAAEDAAGADPAGFGKVFGQQVDAELAQRLEAAPSGARALLEARFALIGADFKEKAGNFEDAALKRQRARDLDGAVNLELAAIRSDPELFEPALAAAEAAIAVSALPEEAKIAARDATRERAARMVIEALNESDPEAARARLDAGEFDGFMAAEVKDRLLDQNAVELRRQEAAAEREDSARRRLLTRRIEDHLASLEATGEGLEGLPDQAALLLDDEAFADFQRRERLAREAFGVMETIRFQAPEAAAAAVEALRPEAGSEGFADRSRLHVGVATALARNLKARVADPAAVAMQAPELARAFREAGDDPAAFQGALERRLGLQRDMGVPERSLRILTGGEAAALAADLEARPGQERAQLIGALEETYGEHFGRAFAELAASGLDPRTLLLGSIDGDPALSQVLGQVIDTGSAELRKGLDGAQVDDLERAVEEGLAGFRGVFEAGDFTGGATAQMNGITAAVTDLALLYHRQGMSAGDAAERAAGQLIGERYAVLDQPRIRAFVPVALEGRPVDVAKVEAAAEAAVSRAAIEAFDPAPIEAPGTDEDLARERTIATAAGSGFWVTNDNGTGLVLMVPFAGGGQLPILNRTGEPFEIDFLEASDLPPAPPDEVFGEGSGF